MGNNPAVGSNNNQPNVIGQNILTDSTVVNFFQQSSTNLNDQRIQQAYEVLHLKGYLISNILGKGAFGVVLEGTNRDSVKVAIKLINIQQNQTLELCKKEVDNLIRANGNRVIKHYDHFQDDECKIYFLITEFCSGGNLDSYLSKNPNLTEERVAQIVLEILLGLRELHDKSFIHSDIKPQNVLFTENGSIKLCDLGFAMLKLNPDQSRVLAEGITFGFCAPEQLQYGQVGFPSDVYAAGLILLCMCYPTKGSQELKYLKENKKDSRFPKFVDIGLSMIEYETQQRPKIPELLKKLTPFIGKDRNYDEELNPISNFLVEMDQFLEKEFNNLDDEINKIFTQS